MWSFGTNFSQEHLRKAHFLKLGSNKYLRLAEDRCGDLDLDLERRRAAEFLSLRVVRTSTNVLSGAFLLIRLYNIDDVNSQKVLG